VAVKLLVTPAHPEVTLLAATTVGNVCTGTNTTEVCAEHEPLLAVK
jgi:hypothetical protein